MPRNGNRHQSSRPGAVPRTGTIQEPSAEGKEVASKPGAPTRSRRGDAGLLESQANSFLLAVGQVEAAEAPEGIPARVSA